MPLKPGKKTPVWTLPATGNQTISSKNLLGSNVVLYFYPRDNTPGCTSEAQDFSQLMDEFSKHNTVVFGVSKDPVASHEKFSKKLQLRFDLLSDEDEKVGKLFDVIRLKKMYGKEFEGIERSTFLIDQTGVLRQEWRKVKVKGHASEVLERVLEI